MAKKFRLKGMKRTMRKLNREVRKLKNRTHKGLVEAALVLQREIEPDIPIDLSNLRHSWFIISIKNGVETRSPSFTGEESSVMKQDYSKVIREMESLAKQMGSDTKPIVVFGYTANYSAFVHENVGADFQRPGAKARWLYKGLQRTRGKMLDAIHKEAKF